MNLTIFQHAKSNPRVGLKLDNAIRATPFYYEPIYTPEMCVFNPPMISYITLWQIKYDDDDADDYRLILSISNYTPAILL